ncbi:DUF3857 and transglutaminase domain-containing protein [Flavobacterium sp. MFBS3-15]|uniref:DUF3857 and transglutaminase domain-containing protein n=1 Tax=Flavobacterium sp. MFBS3-15 TaxID=2989816 RepID=UPI0022367DF3|nr:DUF3857 and transglutaminase domain-containing protein [Flavobacterium sp. MFBS3-15]MCW4468278.1 DUF3857 and transglutaminase domain-containing protein [Flavobacterium sp. MFBS3-15]
MFRAFLVTILFATLPLKAQVATPKPPPVTVSDLSEAAHPVDSTASAAYKYRYGKTWFEKKNDDWVMVTEVYTRLKIYRKAGYEYANAEILYFSDSRRAKGFFSEAATYNLVNGAIEKTPLNEESQFEEEFEEEFTIKKIAMPNVKEGSIIEYKYTIKTPHFGALNDWYFQFDIPVDDVRYDVIIPTYFTYNIYSTGFVEIEEKPLSITFNKKTDVSERHYSYKAVNVPAIKDEEYVNNIDNYTSILKHEIASVQFPDFPPLKLSTDWVTVAKKIYEDDRFGRELKFNSYFEKDIDLVVKPEYTARQKADSIFSFVRGRMSWNKRAGYLCYRGVKKAYSEKSGNAAEINLMLTAMLRHAGLDANPVLVSTRSNGVALFPTRYAYDYVIASVTIDGNTVLMDATSKYSMPDVLPARTLNWVGRLIKKDGESSEISLTPKMNSRETVNVIAAIAADGTVSGQVRDLYADYVAYVLREMLATLQMEEYVEKLESMNKGVTISNYKLSNDKNPAKPLSESYGFTDSMHADLMGGKIYFSPMLHFSEQENPFTGETRNYPVDFIYPLQKRHIITVTLPEGYRVESMPEPVTMVMEENIGSYKYNITAQGNTIQLSSFFDINFPTVSHEYYRTLKDFFSKMIEKQKEKIVLVKNQ